VDKLRRAFRIADRSQEMCNVKRIEDRQYAWTRTHWAGPNEEGDEPGLGTAHPPTCLPCHPPSRISESQPLRQKKIITTRSSFHLQQTSLKSSRQRQSGTLVARIFNNRQYTSETRVTYYLELSFCPFHVWHVAQIDADMYRRQDS
jgi:hypothetical protein